MKFCYGLCDGLVRSLWDRIRAKANTGNFVVGIYCRSQSQEDKTDETSLDVEECHSFKPCFLWELSTNVTSAGQEAVAHK